MSISIIVAVDNNNVIGKDNALIWHLPADMKFFKEKTSGHCIITGRKNYESIPQKFRPLPNRTNIIVTRQADYDAPGAIVVSSIENALEQAKKISDTEIFIIGGAEIFKQSIHLADKLYITHIHHSFEGDVYFPEINKNEWKEITRTQGTVDEKNIYAHDFVTYERSN